MEGIKLFLLNWREIKMNKNKNKKYVKVFLSGILMFVFFSVYSKIVFGQTKMVTGQESSPTIINADSLEINLDQNKAVFLGKVKASQSDGILECRELQVIFDKKNEQISKLIAKGEVKIRQGQNEGVCEEAVYEFTPQQKVTLRGNPELRRGQQKFSGEIIVFLIEEQRVIIKNKVEGVVFPQKGENPLAPIF